MNIIIRISKLIANIYVGKQNLYNVLTYRDNIFFFFLYINILRAIPDAC